MKILSLLLLAAQLLACHGSASKPSLKASPATSADMGQRVPDSGQRSDSGFMIPDALNKDTASLRGEWLLQPVLPSDTATGKRPVLNFRMSNHSFTGNTGCNDMRGQFTSTDSSLVFDERITVTKMNCPGYPEEAFIKSLLHTNRYRIETGVLVLLFNNDELSRWTRKNYKAPVKKSI